MPSLSPALENEQLLRSLLNFKDRIVNENAIKKSRYARLLFIVYLLL